MCVLNSEVNGWVTDSVVQWSVTLVRSSNYFLSRQRLYSVLVARCYTAFRPISPRSTWIMNTNNAPCSDAQILIIGIFLLPQTLFLESVGFLLSFCLWWVITTRKFSPIVRCTYAYTNSSHKRMYRRKFGYSIQSAARSIFLFSCLPFSEKWSGILTQNFTHLNSCFLTYIKNQATFDICHILLQSYEYCDRLCTRTAITRTAK